MIYKLIKTNPDKSIDDAIKILRRILTRYSNDNKYLTRKRQADIIQAS